MTVAVPIRPNINAGGVACFSGDSGTEWRKWWNQPFSGGTPGNPPTTERVAKTIKGPIGDHWRFMHVFCSVMIQPRRSVEGQICPVGTCRKTSKKRADRGHAIEQIMVVDEGMAHDFVLTPKSLPEAGFPRWR